MLLPLVSADADAMSPIVGADSTYFIDLN